MHGSLVMYAEVSVCLVWVHVRQAQSPRKPSARAPGGAKYRLVGMVTLFRCALPADLTLEELREMSPRADQVWEHRCFTLPHCQTSTRRTPRCTHADPRPLTHTRARTHTGATFVWYVCNMRADAGGVGRDSMVRLNVSQFLVLPAFQGQGHGKQVRVSALLFALLLFFLCSFVSLLLFCLLSCLLAHA